MPLPTFSAILHGAISVSRQQAMSAQVTKMPSRVDATPATQSSLFGLGRRFLAWWGAELTGLVPDWFGAAGDSERRCVALVAEPDRVSLIDGSARLPRQLCVAMTGDATAGQDLRRRAQRLARTKGLPIVLRLPRSVCLVRELTVPAATRPKLQQMLALDIERATPLKAADVAFGWTVRQSRGERSALSVTQVIVKQTAIDSALAQCTELGLVPDTLDCARDDLTGFNVDLRAAKDTSVQSGGPYARPLRWLTTACVAMICLIGWQGFHRQDLALAAVEEQFAAAKTRALAQRAAAERTDGEAKGVSALLSMRARRPLAVAIWTDITRLLPDTAYLANLHLEGETLTMSGQAKSAAGLIAILQQSKLISEATLTSPVVYNATTGTEQFEISAKLALPAPSPQAVAGGEVARP